MSKLANIRAAAIGALSPLGVSLQEFVDVINLTELPAIGIAHNVVSAGDRELRGDGIAPQTREDRQGELTLHCASEGDTEALAADAAETLGGERHEPCALDEECADDQEHHQRHELGRGE